MSYSLASAALKLDLPRCEKFVLIAFCEHADSTAQAHPGLTRIATLTGYKIRAVERAVQRLRKLGILIPASGQSVRGRGLTVRYEIHLEKAAILAGLQYEKPVKNDGKNPSFPTEKPVTNADESSLEAKSIEAAAGEVWNTLGIIPCGTLQFQVHLQSCWAGKNGHLPSDVIGTAIDAWETEHRAKPPGCSRLFRALGELRKREALASRPAPVRLLRAVDMRPEH